MDYNPIEFEARWKKYWQDNKIYEVSEDKQKPKFYVLDMFPYPSGAGLHVGHPLGYIASDIISRYKRMKGFNVLHPMGFDSFGLPAEEYAIQTGVHPETSTSENMVRYKEQLTNIGLSFDWSRSLHTSDPSYYKWTQWIFTLLFDHCYYRTSKKAKPITQLIDHLTTKGTQELNIATSNETEITAAEWSQKSEKEKSEFLMQYRLAFRKIGFVNWCEELGTVLANDQVKDGVSERGGYPVIQKAMTQWYLRITAYADRLLYGLDNIEWSESLKTIQKNWIGRSEGASIQFQVEGHNESIEVFTTRPDTIYGATYMVLAPEHDLVSKLTTAEQSDKVEAYLSYVKSKSEIDRMAEKEVTGEFIGAYAINPFNNEKVPIWIGEYVLKDYGTGAIMAVPSDDDRDQAFATKFGLPIIEVVDKSKYKDATLSDKLGVIINSDFLNGMEVPEAIKAACLKAEELNVGKTRVNYKMRDANFSRQRYWGEPFPIVYNEEDIASTLPLDQLPLKLPPTDDFKPGKGGKSPLSRMTEWNQIDENTTRETDVMPAVAGSSWYYLRYMDPHNNEEFANKDSVDYWQDVDLYVGGAEHAVAHLMYARFWHKFLHDLEYVPTDEPFKKLVNQGMIQGVIEFILLLKEKENGRSKFICAELAKAKGITDYIKIPIKVEYVQNYGSDNSYLSKESIDNFIAWRSEFKDAIFECGNGTYQNQTFTSNGKGDQSNLVTISEVGKMSKSKFNVINPDEVVAKYGTDCFRMYEMFLGPIQQSKPWDTNGIDGVSKFLRKVWNLIYDGNQNVIITEEKANPAELKVIHTAIKKISKDIEAMSMNTAVSAFMICVNELKKSDCHKKEIIELLIRLLSPFAPFVSEELWAAIGNNTSVHLADFPEHNEEYLKESEIEYPICINGKKRTLMKFDADATKESIEALVLGHEEMQKWIDGKQIKKVVVVPKRMVNIVV